ncbi:glycosyltransferase family 4 protein [Acetobacterium tundrae]|nr:glycosyltransferase family 4 protein [Acetobacterium tundrae]
MQIVIVHGYFLKGTGSNLFVENVCRELCKIGHQVNLFCQENDPDKFDFIEKAFDFNGENSKSRMIYSKKTPYMGKCDLYRPNLNGFLPVYVYDKYEGYEVKTFTSCTKEEIESYIENNRQAINTALVNTHTDMVWTNHTIMQPVYVARSHLGQCQHVMTVHGSCLNFSVRNSPLLQDYAKEANANADRIAFVSRFSENEFLEFFNNDSRLKEKSIAISGGVDLEKFMTLNDSSEKKHVINKLVTELEIEEKRLKNNLDSDEGIWKTDRDIISKLKKIDFENEKIVLYYGKYLWTKGVQLLIAAAPLIMKDHQDVRFILIGFGSSRTYFEAMIEALNKGEKEAYIELITHPDLYDKEIDPNSANFFSLLTVKLKDEDFAQAYFSAAKGKIGSAFVLTGFLGHNHLKSLIACSEITVAPSIFPEAFGLVAAEALSSGVIPIQTNHSGFSEVIKIYVDEFCDIFDKYKLNKLFLNENLVLNLAENISVFLDYYSSMNDKVRQTIRERARKISVENYSWESVVKNYLRLYEEQSITIQSAKKAEYIFTISDYVKEEVLSLYDVDRKKVIVTGNGYDQTIFRPNKKLNRKTVMTKMGYPNLENYPIVTFCGKISKTKGIDVLLEANKYIQKKNKVYILIMGSGNIDSLGKGNREKLHMENVLILGQRSQHELAMLHNIAKLSVLPSRSEGFGIAALEAMGCKKPVVVTRVGGLPSFAVGKIVESENANELAEGILEILNMEEFAYYTICQKAYHIAIEYSWENIVNIRMKYYNKLVVNQQLTSANCI